MTWRTTDAIGQLRQAADEDPLTFTGTLVPYGQLSGGPVKDYGKPEAFAPGAFARSVDHWMTRSDGARMPFRSAHGAPPIGTAQVLSDEPDGVRFSVRLLDTAAGREYADGVRAGLNGVSIEFNPVGEPVRKGGFVLHREAKLYGAAGSVTPAYDGARLSLRDMEDEVTETTEDRAEPAPARTTEDIVKERDGLAAVTRGAPEIRTIRAEAVYGRDATPDDRGEQPRFLRDFYAMHHGDTAAAERWYRHQAQLTDIAKQMERSGRTYAELESMERAGDVLSSEIPGAYPNVYLPGLFTPRIFKGRPMGGFYERFPISDALPKIFAKATTATTAAVQGAENVNPAASDFATTAVTVNPLLYGASTLVSRQVVDGASPAAETMILQDMYEAYSQASEAVIKTAVEAGSSASGTAITAATPYAGSLGNVIAYFAARFRGAGALFVPSLLYPVLMAQGDTTGRPFLPQIGAINSDGTIEAGATQAAILGAKVFLSWQSTVNVVVTAAANDFVIFESPLATFRYEQATGPSAFNIGCWAYLGVGARLGSLKVTAA